MSGFPQDPDFEPVVQLQPQVAVPTRTPLECANEELRRERDRLLAETDWMVTKAAEVGQPLAPEWAAYRQALRNLPQSATIELNKYEHLDWTKVEWPQKPEAA